MRTDIGCTLDASWKHLGSILEAPWRHLLASGTAASDYRASCDSRLVNVVHDETRNGGSYFAFRMPNAGSSSLPLMNDKWRPFHKYSNRSRSERPTTFPKLKHSHHTKLSNLEQLELLWNVTFQCWRKLENNVSRPLGDGRRPNCRPH